jgi:hypothetical protein
MGTLEGTVLAGSSAYEGPEGTLVISGIEPERLIQSWRAARSVIPQSGRWPIMVTTEFSPLEDVIWDGPDRSDLADLDIAARRIDPWTYYDDVYEEPSISARHIDSYLQGLPDDVTQDAIRELPVPTTISTLERWVYDRLLSEPQLVEPIQPRIERLAGVENWYQPDEVHVAFLPTNLSWLSPYWVGAGDRYWLSTVQWQWHDRRGAEIVADWGTMQQFLVSNPPEPGDQAWELAGQLKKVGSSLQDEQWLLALALPHANAWFLHDRP